MIAQTFRTVAGLGDVLRALFVTTLIFRAGTMAYPFLSAYLLQQGEFSPGQIGALVACFGVGALLADLVASVVLGRVGPRAAMVCGLVFNSGALVGTPLLDGPAAIIGAILVWGFAHELFTPASYAATMAGSAPADRKTAFACNRLAINLGMGIGPAIGGVLFAVNPVVLFWVNAVCALSAAAYLMRHTTADAGSTDTGTTDAGTPETRRPRLVAGSVRAETRFWTIFGLSLPIQLAYTLPPAFASVYVIAGLGLPSYWASAIFVVNAVVIVLFEIPLNKAMANMRYLPTLALGYGLTAAGFLLTGLSDSGLTVVLSTLVWTAGEMIVFPGLLGYVSELSEGALAGRNMSLYSGGVNIAFIVTPQLALLLSSNGDAAAPWLAAAATVGIAFALLLAAGTNSYTWHRVAAQPTR